jgi:hypothetical protein
MLVSPSDETCFIYLRTVVLDTPENKLANIGRSKKTTWWRNLVEIMALSFGPYFEGEKKRSLVKGRILHHLGLTDLVQCKDCMHSTRVLEIIHIDICGPFPVRTVDGFDLFITFTHDYSRYDYIYPFFKGQIIRFRQVLIVQCWCRKTTRFEHKDWHIKSCGGVLRAPYWVWTGPRILSRGS